MEGSEKPLVGAEPLDPTDELPDDPGYQSVLTRDEWLSGVAQRGALTMLGFRDGDLTLMRTSPDGQSAMITIDAGDRMTVAAAALAASHSLAWEDYDDEILTAVLLSLYQRGVTFDQLEKPLQEAVGKLIVRRYDLARRLAALLPPLD